MPKITLPPCGIAALELVKLGYHPVPVAPGSKVPISQYRLYGERKGFQASLKTEAGIVEAWTAYPDANLAICLPGLVQVDLDTAESVEAVKALNLPKVPTIRTPRAERGEGGLRMIYRDSGMFEKKSGKGKVDGIEWSRGPTMIGLVGPSLFRDPDKGGPYKTVVPFADAEPVSLSQVPELVALLEPSREAKRPEASESARKTSGLPEVGS